MTDEFSINDVNRKRSLKQNDAIDDLRTIDHGEAAWDLGEKESARPKSDKNIAPDDIPQFPPMPGFGDDEEPAKPSSLDIIRLLRGVWGRRNLVLMATVAGTLLFVLLAFTLLKHKWEANVVMLKREQLDSFQIGSTGQPFRQQNYSLKTMLDTLKLPSILIETITKSGIDASPRSLSSAIDLHLGKESNVFSISVTWDDAKMAASIANILADEFIKRNVSMRREDAMQVYEYYGAQLAKAEAEYKAVYDKLLTFQNENGVVNFDSQTEVMLTKVAELEIEYQTLKAELEVGEKSFTRMQETLEATPVMVVGQSIYRSPLKTKLGELEWQLEQARGRYTDKNPKVTDLIEQVNSLKKHIDEGNDDTAPEQHMEVNPVRQELEIKVIDLQDEIKLKNARVDSLKSSIDKLNAKLSSMTEKQKEYFQLNADKDSASGVIGILRNRVEEARVIMLSGNGDFEIVERARMPDEPKSSGRKILVIAGFILSGGAGLFIALLMEFLSPIVRTRKEVIGITQIENVFEIQHIPYKEQDVIDINRPDEKIAVIFRRLVNDLYSSLNDKSLQSVAFISAGRESGRSLVMTNLAQALALKEKSSLLVDADMVKDAGTSLAEYFEMEKQGGDILSLLNRQSKVNQSIFATESMKVLLLPYFHDETINHPELLLGSSRMAELIKVLRKFKGSVFYDLPPLMKYETAYEATAEIGHAILVVRSGICQKNEIQHIVERLNATNVELLAVILTDIPEELMHGNLQFVSDFKGPVKKK